MSTSHVFRYGAGSLAVVATLVALAMSIIGSSPPASPPTVPQDPAAAAPRFIGDIPLPLAEPKKAVLQTTPHELLASVLDAISRRDVAALARCSSTTAGRPALDQIDQARAERDFFDGEQLWTRLATAQRNKTLRVDDVRQPVLAETDREQKVDAVANVVFPASREATAGLTELQVALVRIAGAWFVRVSP